MHLLATLTLAITSLAVSATAQALVCKVPGTTVSWATDQCLLETAATDATSQVVLDCLKAANTIRQPCEWNESYKKTYCATLIDKRQFHGSIKDCIADPSTVGPTVQEFIREHSDEP